MKYAFALAFIFVIIYTTLRATETEFDFTAATPSERTAYLSARSDRVKTRLNSGLRQRYGVIRSFGVESVRLNRSGYVAMVNFKEPPPGGSFNRTFQQEMTKALCKSYINSKTSEHKISISVILSDMTDKTTAQLTLSNPACRRYEAN